MKIPPIKKEQPKKGIIFSIAEKSYFGLALNADQVKDQLEQGKVLLRLYEDENCTRPFLNKETGKQQSSVKHISTLMQIGYQD